MGIDVIDHLILCDDNFRSLKEVGYIKRGDCERNNVYIASINEKTRLLCSN